MPRLLLLTFAAILCAAWPMERVGAQEISVRDTPLPDASTFGIDSPRFPHVSFAGLPSQGLSALLDGVSPALGPGVGRDIMLALLTMPVYPDSTDALPADWFTYRIDRMIRLGAYADALRLTDALPENLRSENTERRRVDLALTLGDVDAACKRVEGHFADDNAAGSGYWSLRQIFCHKLAGKDEQAELMLAVYQEQFPGEQPVALSVLGQWGNARALLPDFSVADAESVPLLIAAIRHAPASHAAERLSAGFLPPQEVERLNPAFAFALAERGVFPLAQRVAMLARAVESGAADPSVLRELLEKSRPADAMPPDYRAQAALLADIGATQSAENKAATVANALNSFKRAYTPYVARGMVSAELESFAAAPQDYPLTPELMLDMAAYGVERNNAARVQQIVQDMERRSQSDEGFAVALAAVRSALYYNRQLGNEQSPAATVPELSAPQRAGVMWMLRRLVSVQEAAGVQIPPKTEALSRAAPLAQTASADPAQMLALEQAQHAGRGGEIVLRCVQLMGKGTLAYVSDEAFARCVGALQEAQQPTYAAALAQAAILNPPVAPLQTVIAPAAGSAP